MAGDELFKRYMEIGSSIVGMSRSRAESIVRELVASGEVARSQAGKAADWLVERGRQGTEEVAELVRREIREQVAALGLATKDDVARVEAKLEEVRAATAAPAAAASEGARKAGAGRSSKSAGISRSASVEKPAGRTTRPKG